jgi:proteasome lid subunit RPN8/RPN11
MMDYHPFGLVVEKEATIHAQEVHPNESVGMVVGGEYIRLENNSDDPENSFLVNSNDFDKAYAAGEIECLIHSHEDFDMASKEDMEFQQNLEIPFGIVSLKNKSLIQIAYFGDQLPERPPLKGRRFFWGAYDCLTLTRDYFKEKFNIILPNPPRDWGFWSRKEKVFENYFNTEPVKRIYEMGDIKENDLLLYNCFGGVVNHIGIYVGNNQVMHHFIGELSGLRPITYMQKYINYIFRHEEVE